MNAFSTLTLAIAMAAGASIATAQDNGHADHGSHGTHGTHSAHASHAGDQAPAGLVDGEVRKIDKDAGKLTLRHGEIKNLDMAAMTMVFRVQDPAMLDQVKVGDKLRFSAERVNGAVTVTQIQKAQ